MSANNYIQIKETSPDKYEVSERDYESEGELHTLGLFASIKLAVRKAEEYIREIEHEVEYGIRFSLMESGVVHGEEKKSHKDFDSWNAKKKWIDSEQSAVFFHVREVWWCSLGINIGFEQDGKGEKSARPVLVFKKFNNEICLALPLSLQVKTKEKTAHFYSAVSLEDGIPRTALLSQVRLIDRKRLLTKIGMIDEVNYKDIQKAVIRLCSM